MIVVMGVSGCGKTVVGKALASRLKLPFYDADDFHPPANILKMKSGRPLTDRDRYPWLQHLAEDLQRWEKEGGAVLACSALKEEYRKILSASTNVNWVYLSGNFETIFERMKEREHFMKSEMLQSQFDTLEVPGYGIHVNISHPPEEIVSRIITQLKTNE